MPANLPPVYHEAKERLQDAVTKEEKIAALEEMLRVMPKHKGTDKLQADLRSRISALRKEPEKKPARGGPSYRILREGAGQIALVGPPNSGKSALVDALTHAEPEVAPYPLSTRTAVPGMMPFEDISFQLVDLPPVCEEHVEFWVYDNIRGADMAWLVLAAGDLLEGAELVERLLAEKAIVLVPWDDDGPEEEERRQGWTYQPTLMVVTGADRPGARGDVEAFEELVAAAWPKVVVSSETGEGFEELGRRTFEALGIIRVYSKEPGRKPDMEQPFTLPRGATVGDLARKIHRDIAENFRFARLWGESAYDGQKVPVHHELEEGDVVEIHT